MNNNHHNLSHVIYTIDSALLEILGADAKAALRKARAILEDEIIKGLPDVPPDLLKETEGRMIEAIKRYRLLTGCDLIPAKIMVERARSMI